MQQKTISLVAGEEGNIDLDDSVFGVEVRSDILHRVVRWQLARRRAGTHKVKTRGEVSYSKRKVVRQKRTGSARHGARSANIFRHGGVAGGPVPRSHAHDLPKRVRRLGLRMALSAKVRAGALDVLEDMGMAESKTKALRQNAVIADAVPTLVIGGTELDPNFVRAARNIPNVDVLPSPAANVYDILSHERLILTRQAVGELAERLR